MLNFSSPTETSRGRRVGVPMPASDAAGISTERLHRPLRIEPRAPPDSWNAEPPERPHGRRHPQDSRVWGDGNPILQNSGDYYVPAPKVKVTQVWQEGVSPTYDLHPGQRASHHKVTPHRASHLYGGGIVANDESRPTGRHHDTHHLRNTASDIGIGGSDAEFDDAAVVDKDEHGEAVFAATSTTFAESRAIYDSNRSRNNHSNSALWDFDYPDSSKTS